MSTGKPGQFGKSGDRFQKELGVFRRRTELCSAKEHPFVSAGQYGDKA